MEIAFPSRRSRLAAVTPQSDEGTTSRGVSSEHVKREEVGGGGDGGGRDVQSKEDGDEEADEDDVEYVIGTPHADFGYNLEEKISAESASTDVSKPDAFAPTSTAANATGGGRQPHLAAWLRYLRSVDTDIEDSARGLATRRGDSVPVPECPSCYMGWRTVPCNVCNAIGKTGKDRTIRCYACSGSGKRHVDCTDCTSVLMPLDFGRSYTW